MADNRNPMGGFGYSSPNRGSKQKSKYVRNPSEKRTSKYVRDKNDTKPRSKYARDKNESREHHYNLTRNYREEEEILEELTEEELEAQETENEALETEAEGEIAEVESEAVEEISEPEKTGIEEASDIPQAEEEEPSLKSVEEYEKEKNGGEKKYTDEVTNLFAHSKLSKETTVARVENEEEYRKRLIILTIVMLVGLTAAACALQYATIKSRYLPGFMSIEFSAFPELIASLAYGPVFGIIIIIIKNLFSLFVTGAAYGSIVSNVVLDSIFVVIGGLFYSNRMFSINPKTANKPKNKDLRRRRIFVGGLAATGITTFAAFFLTRFVSYPLLVRQYSERGITNGYLLSNYQYALDSLNASHPELVSSTVSEFTSLTQAILFYNMPLTLIKYLIVAIAATIVYPAISPYIHFRKNTK